MQKGTRIGRIDVDAKEQEGRTVGFVSVPSSMDQPTTALLAASLESIEKVGPYNAKFTLLGIEDFRERKRKEIVNRAQEIMQRWKALRRTEDTKAIANVVEITELSKPINWGPDQLPAGPEAETAEDLTIVEGRADVSILIAAGIKNSVATNGVNVPQSLVNLTKNKRRVMAFLDGDRVGEMILRELLRSGAKLDSIVRAPVGKEVEELSPAEILDLAGKATPVQEYLTTLEVQKRGQLDEKQLNALKEGANHVKGKLLSVILSNDGGQIAEIPVGELFESLDQHREEFAIIFDGVITQRIVDKAESLGYRVIVGERIGKVEKKPSETMVLRIEDLQR